MIDRQCRYHDVFTHSFQNSVTLFVLLRPGSKARTRWKHFLNVPCFDFPVHSPPPRTSDRWILTKELRTRTNSGVAGHTIYRKCNCNCKVSHALLSFSDCTDLPFHTLMAVCSLFPQSVMQIFLSCSFETDKNNY